MISSQGREKYFLHSYIGVEFFNFLVAGIFNVKIPGNERDAICIVQYVIYALCDTKCIFMKKS